MAFVSFGGGRDSYRQSVERIGREALHSGAFDEIHTFTDDDVRRLSPTFADRHAGILRPDIRGFGFWIWKPFFLSHVLSDTSCDVVVYADAGCHLNLGTKSPIARLHNYVDIAGEYGMFVMNLGRFTEEQWTKADTLARLGLSPDQCSSSQRLATMFVLAKTHNTLDFTREWLAIAEEDNCRFLDDSPSIAPNHPDFVDHRHDQSIFSCLTKVAGIPSLRDESTSHGRRKRFDTGVPIWSTRNRTGTPFDPRADRWKRFRR